jgi:acetylornithine deacetylase
VQEELMARDIAEQVRARISAQEVADLAFELVQVPSPTGSEEAVARLYAERLEGCGVPTRFLPVGPGRPNVVGHVRGHGGEQGGGQSLMLYGHLDTIPPEGCVAPRREEDVVWGRGTSDMKGSLAAMALAARAVVELGVRLRGDLLIAGGVGHEIPWPLHPTLGHGDGAKLLAGAIRSGELQADCCVIGEGPMDAAWVVQGGLAPWRLTVSGGPGAIHSTTTTLDHNPAVWAAEVVRDLYDYGQEIARRGTHPLIGQAPRVEVGVVASGDYFNRNPAAATIVGNVRWHPGWSEEEIHSHFRARLAALRERLAARYGDDSIRLDLFIRTGKAACDAREHPGTARLVEALGAAARPVVGPLHEPCGGRAATDLEIFHRIAGIPTVGFGPGLMPDALPSGKRPGGAHSDDEGVSVEALGLAARVYAGLILEVCGVA